MSAFCTVYPRSAALPVSWGGVHSKAALEPQTSTNLILLGGPGLSESFRHGIGHSRTQMHGNHFRSAPFPSLLSQPSLHAPLCPTLRVGESPGFPSFLQWLLLSLERKPLRTTLASNPHTIPITEMSMVAVASSPPSCTLSW